MEYDSKKKKKKKNNASNREHYIAISGYHIDNVLATAGDPFRQPLAFYSRLLLAMTLSEHSNSAGDFLVSPHQRLYLS